MHAKSARTSGARVQFITRLYLARGIIEMIVFILCAIGNICYV